MRKSLRSPQAQPGTFTSEVIRLIRLGYKAAVYDFWQTLAHAEGVNAPAIWQAHGFDEAAAWQAMQELEYDFMIGRITLADWPMAVAAKAGFELDAQQAASITAELQAAWIRHCRPYPGVREALALQRGHGVKTAVCSNANPFTRAVIEHYFGDVLDAVVVSCDTGIMKPEPGIYAAALEALGYDAGTASFAGDGGHGELEGARKFGFKLVVAVRSKEGWRARHPEESLAGAAELDSVSQIGSLLGLPGSA